MELLSNSATNGSLKRDVSAGNLTNSDSSGSNSEPKITSNDDLSNNLFISNLLNALPRWDYSTGILPEVKS
jgi:hypothetical protein